MRIWSLHPSVLDRQGLIACWRETLLAQAVLLGRTRGYTRHPQLERFRAHPDPVAAVGAYLCGLHQEATARGYRFDAGRIERPPEPGAVVEPLAVTTGQLAVETEHLRAKLARRSPEMLETLEARLVAASPEAHPLFRVVPGDVEPWERGAGR
ncbi:pyrimidine dimer DNA glycosylase/endonuclease V [Nesterenkonia halobia]|uniref:Pyrimidine dimer DNA glycosylase/endonuclease V n=1 Tax=Nesterenkonia halobia TaxID=37922 RepID=A0ABP6RHS2_9MICC